MNKVKIFNETSSNLEKKIGDFIKNKRIISVSQSLNKTTDGRVFIYCIVIYQETEYVLG